MNGHDATPVFKGHVSSNSLRPIQIAVSHEIVTFPQKNPLTNGKTVDQIDETFEVCQNIYNHAPNINLDHYLVG